jgi:hypothetical protein
MMRNKREVKSMTLISRDSTICVGGVGGVENGEMTNKEEEGMREMKKKKKKKKNKEEGRRKEEKKNKREE